MLVRRQLQALRAIAFAPLKDRANWLAGAQEGVEFLKSNATSDYILLYASLGMAYVQSALAPVEALTPAKTDELISAHLDVDHGWCIQHEWGSEGRKIYLEGPLRGAGIESLAEGEQLVFRRIFNGLRQHRPVVEICQRLVQALDLHFLPERNSYCRLDERGDLEDVIYVVDQPQDADHEHECAVLILAEHLAKYMAVSNQAMFRKFDFTRYPEGSFTSWGDGSAEISFAPDLFYSRRVVPGHASYVNGGQIIRTGLTVADLIRAEEGKADPTRRRYETFKIFDRKNDALVETSCGPDGVVNYFTKSDKPWEISPAFFRPDVLARFKADPDKYDLTDRDIRCRNAWSLRTYDINEAGQVHTYIGYLANLPFEEQQYWKLYNEWPKDSISRRAFENDILGEWTSERDPLRDIKHVVCALDKQKPIWWKPRGEVLVDRVLAPTTSSSKEWADEILALDQLIVEGFLPKALRIHAQALGVTTDPGWASLRLIEAIIEGLGATPDQAKARVASLRRLHFLRTKVKGHASGEGKELEREALAKYGSFRAHFLALCGDCHDALSAIVEALARIDHPVPHDNGETVEGAT
ncbi:MAG: hypothetical protein P4L64_18725 [Caulobacteraceae bacterium]|nr:hypothetical protein [Caulobacteraceae bacterium]